jgi:uncharacterized protein (DUF58 family)
MIRLKPAGKTLIFSAAALTLLHALLPDTLILSAAAAATSLTLYSLLTAWRKAGQLKKLTVNPEHIELRMVAGMRHAVEARIESDKPAVVSVEHPIRFCRARPQPYRLNERLTLEFSPNLAGVYRSEWIAVEAEAPLKAFIARAHLPFKTSLIVLPRVAQAVVRALELLAALGATAYEVPVQTIGRGTEYAETREYMPGDELRRVDWKATARLQKLMVKQFHQDSGGAVNLVYDLKTAGPVTRDEAAAEFLTLATMLTAQATPYTITLVDEQNRLQTMKFSDTRTALLKAVKTVLETMEFDHGILYELVEPQTMREMLTLLRIIDQTVDEKTPKSLEAADTIAVTCLLGDLTWLRNIYDTLKASDRKLILHIPSKIWLDSTTLEQAYTDHEKQIRLTAKLKKLGIEIKYTDFTKPVSPLYHYATNFPE